RLGRRPCRTDRRRCRSRPCRPSPWPCGPGGSRAGGRRRWGRTRRRLRPCPSCPSCPSCLPWASCLPCRSSGSPGTDHAPNLGQSLTLALEHEMDQPLALVVGDLLEHERPAALVIGPDDTRVPLDLAHAGAQAEPEPDEGVELEAIAPAQEHAAPAQVEGLAVDPDAARVVI